MDNEIHRPHVADGGGKGHFIDSAADLKHDAIDDTELHKVHDSPIDLRAHMIDLKDVQQPTVSINNRGADDSVSTKIDEFPIDVNSNTYSSGGEPHKFNGEKVQANGLKPGNGAGSNPIDVQINDLKFRGFISDLSSSTSSSQEFVAVNGASSASGTIHSASVANFLNIPYARIPARFRQAVPINPRQERGTIDATRYGPRCPQPLDVLHAATSHLYPRMGTLDRQSEFECLNLNIYAPASALAEKQRVPVLVWIHGGAFTYGDGGCEFDGNYLVRRSVLLGKPLVVVSLSYRLGYFGFLSSKELRDEAHALGEVGFGNQGLIDQRLGLQWIQQNIHFFGGDGFRLTAAGESAGAFAILAHLRSNFPAFQQAFMLSCPSVSLQTQEQSQETFDRLVEEGTRLLPSAPAGDKLSALRSLSPQEMESLLHGQPAFVNSDKEFFDYWSGFQIDDSSQPFPSWAKLVVVGETKDECALFSQQWESLNSEQLLRDWKAALPDALYAKEVMDAYEITDVSSHSDLVNGMIKYTTDCLFSRATHSIATTPAFSKVGPTTFIYSFDVPDVVSPISSFKGRSYHSLDNTFFFHLPPVASASAPHDFQATADAYSKACIDLVSSEHPWEAYSIARRCMSFDGEKTRLVEATERDCGFKRWGPLMSTPERAKMFMGGRELLFGAMKYAMAVDVKQGTK